jgi:cytochrome c peroxidase
MKNLVKTGFALFALLAFTGCSKSEMNPVSGNAVVTRNTNPTDRSYHDGTDDGNGTDIIGDRDKCKKCHTGKAMGIDWNAPYMHDGRYKTIEELINDFDFINNQHGLGNQGNSISDAAKQDLLNYLDQEAADSKR